MSHYMADKATQAISTTSDAKAFRSTVDPGITVVMDARSLGIARRVGGGPHANNGFFVGSFPSTKIYLSSNFRRCFNAADLLDV